jgi:hypothetical protein
VIEVLAMDDAEASKRAARMAQCLAGTLNVASLLASDIGEVGTRPDPLKEE